MSKGNTVLQSLTSHISRYEFQKSVNLFDGDKKVRTLTTRNLFMALCYAQLTKSFSIAELQASLNANSSRLYHSGIKTIKKSTFADALANRDSQIFEAVFHQLLAYAHTMYTGSRRYRSPLRIIDATTIALCVTSYDWAKYRTTKGAIKLHASFDPDSQLPHQVFLSNGGVHENTTLQNYECEEDDILVFDRGYVNYKSFYRLTLAGSTFVTRLKRNATVTKAITRAQPDDSPVLEDSVGTFAGKNACQDYPGTIRAIIYRDPETGKMYRFLTNNLDLSAQSIADIYKQRWQIELFFKWIKQNLKIKTFFGTSRNAVWSQIYVALSIHLLIWLTKVIQGIEMSLQRIMQVLKVTALDKRPIHDLFYLPDPDPPPDSLPLFEGAL